jgi:NADPH:quinone reductase-like Zn-dependent oxidoreductase
MRTTQLTAANLNSFRTVDMPEPRPGPRDVLVRLRAASLNFIDIAVATGNFPVPGFPMIPVADGAGEVAAVGESVTTFKIGDRVVPHFMPRWSAGAITPDGVSALRGVTEAGSLAEYVVVPDTGLVSVPAHLSYRAAATLPIAATTAWNGMKAGHVRPGSTVLLLGTGGVSVFALQFAKAFGATVVLISSSEEKLERARRLGADLTINYRSHPDWDAEVRRLTDGRGVDLVVETVGEQTFNRSLSAAAFGGVVFVIGFLSGANPAVSLFPLITKGLEVRGNNTGSVADLREAATAIAAHQITPVVDRVFEVGAVAEAYAHLAAGGRHFGKLAIELWA